MEAMLIRGQVGALGIVLGERLVGATVMTDKCGAWAGGYVTVTEFLPDAAAPEIPYWVKSIETGREIGLFDDEYITLLIKSEHWRKELEAHAFRQIMAQRLDLEAVSAQGLAMRYAIPELRIEGLTP